MLFWAAGCLDVFSVYAAREAPRSDSGLRWLCCARGASYSPFLCSLFLQNMPHLRVAARALFRIFTALAYGLPPPNNGLSGTNDSLVGANDGLPPANENHLVCRLWRSRRVARAGRHCYPDSLRKAS